MAAKMVAQKDVETVNHLVDCSENESVDLMVAERVEWSDGLQTACLDLTKVEMVVKMDAQKGVGMVNYSVGCWAHETAENMVVERVV